MGSVRSVSDISVSVVRLKIRLATFGGDKPYSVLLNGGYIKGDYLIWIT